MRSTGTYFETDADFCQENLAAREKFVYTALFLLACLGYLVVDFEAEVISFVVDGTGGGQYLGDIKDVDPVFTVKRLVIGERFFDVGKEDVVAFFFEEDDDDDPFFLGDMSTILSVIFSIVRSILSH